MGVAAPGLQTMEPSQRGEVQVQPAKEFSDAKNPHARSATKNAAVKRELPKAVPYLRIGLRDSFI
jgi:hypothetical protein